MSKYRIERAKLGDEWDAFVQKSPNGTLFSYSKYLEAIGNVSDLWYVTKGNETKAAVALMRESIPGPAILHDWVIYNGLMFGLPDPNKSIASFHSERFAITEFVADFLPTFYPTMEFQLHPSVTDIRPFLWVNYGEEDADHYTVDVRFTSYVQVFAGLAEEFHLARMSKARRQEIQYARRDGVEVKEEGFIGGGRFVKMYEQTMGEFETMAAYTRMAQFLQTLYMSGLTRTFTAYVDGNPASMVVMGMDSKRAYFLFGASNPEFRNSHAGSLVVWEAILRCGRSMVDLEGVNSPARGWFKQSFGGSLVPYYGIRYE